MAAEKRREANERARLRKLQGKWNDITNDAARILEDPGDDVEYTGFFKACPPWITVDLESGDVNFSQKLSAELHQFSDEFLTAIKWDVADFRGRRCIFATFPSKQAFFDMAHKTTVPLQRLYGKSSFDGAWTTMECLNIIEWFNFPQDLGFDCVRKLGDLRKALEQHFSAFLPNIKVVNVDRKPTFLRIEFSRDLSTDDVAAMKANPYTRGESVSVSGLWYNGLYQCRFCGSSAHHHNTCPQAKAVYQIVHTNRVYKPKDLKPLAKLVGASQATLGVAYSTVQKTSCKTVTFIYNSKKALLDKEEINLSFVSKRCPPNGPYGSVVCNFQDLDSYCGKCGWRRNSSACQCKHLEVIKSNINILSWLKPKAAIGSCVKVSRPAQPPPKFGPQTKPKSSSPASQNGSQASKPIPNPPPKPNASSQPQQIQRPNPAPNIRSNPANPQLSSPAPDIKQSPPQLSDVKTERSFRKFLEYHGVRYRQGIIPHEVIRSLRHDIENTKNWKSYASRSEAVYGDVLNFPGIGYTYGTPPTFHPAAWWPTSFSELSSEIAARFSDVPMPNLTPVIKYEAGQSFPRHKDKSKECKEAGYTFVVAIGPRVFKFCNQREKSSGYIETEFPMADGDVLYIPKCMNWGKNSVFHFTEPTNTQHFSVVLKKAKAPSLF